MKLTVQNIPAYLRSLGIFPGVDWEKASVTEIVKHTNVNFIFRAVLGSGFFRSIYLKQAFNFVKVSPNYPAPLSRQEYEKLAIDYLWQYWPDRIPKVIHWDSQNHILLLTDIGRGTKNLAEEIEQGRLHLAIGDDLGQLMAKLHAPTFGKRDYPVRGKRANIKHVDFIFDFRLGGARNIFPEETFRLFKESLGVKTSIIHADWPTKNLLVTRHKRLRVVDFENLVRFDPAFDIGYALAHWVLEITSQNQAQIVQFCQNFEKAYRKDWPDQCHSDLDDIFRRAAKYTGAMMLHRFAGVKNTNRLDKYLARQEFLTDLAGYLVKGDFATPSIGISGSLRITVAP